MRWLRAGLPLRRQRSFSWPERGVAVLAPSELSALSRLHDQWNATGSADELALRYYMGMQRVEQLGLAIPQTMRRFVVVANWPRVVVDTICSRQQVRALILPGEERADPELRTIWDDNNLSAHVAMFNVDRCVYGRAFMSVGANEGGKSPIVRVESPRQMVAEVDQRTERMVAAARFYGSTSSDAGPTQATLYLPDVTIWMGRRDGRWVELDRNVHGLGAVPVVMHLNRRLSGGWQGFSEMSDVAPLADAAVRSLTNLQFAQESHGIPRMYMTGVAQGDFVDASGKPVPKFEAYFNAIHTLTNAEAKVGQLSASDLKNFETALDIYGRQASIVTGFPARYFGLHTANPPAEGAIRADEAQLVRSVETQNEQLRMTLGWVGALAYRVATGREIEGNRVAVEMHDPATPTVAQREDALMKRRSQGVLSIEGYWDELGWTEARKAKEREYLALEAADPMVARLDSLLSADVAPTDG